MRKLLKPKTLHQRTTAEMSQVGRDRGQASVGINAAETMLARAHRRYQFHDQKAELMRQIRVLTGQLEDLAKEYADVA